MNDYSTPTGCVRAPQTHVYVLGSVFHLVALQTPPLRRDDSAVYWFNNLKGSSHLFSLSTVHTLHFGRADWVGTFALRQL